MVMMITNNFGLKLYVKNFQKYVMQVFLKFNLILRGKCYYYYLSTVENGGTMFSKLKEWEDSYYSIEKTWS